MSRILLLEPDRQLAGNLKDYFANANHEVYVHTDAQAAIAEADKQRPDIVIAELQLASRSGIEFLYEFRSYPEWQDIAAIITGNISADNMYAYVETFEELNINGYFYKPALRLDQLAKAVNDCLKTKAS